MTEKQQEKFKMVVLTEAENATVTEARKLKEDSENTQMANLQSLTDYELAILKGVRAGTNDEVPLLKVNPVLGLGLNTPTLTQTEESVLNLIKTHGVEQILAQFAKQDMPVNIWGKNFLEELHLILLKERDIIRENMYDPKTDGEKSALMPLIVEGIMSRQTAKVIDEGLKTGRNILLTGSLTSGKERILEVLNDASKVFLYVKDNEGNLGIDPSKGTEGIYISKNSKVDALELLTKSIKRVVVNCPKPEDVNLLGTSVTRGIPVTLTLQTIKQSLSKEAIRKFLKEHFEKHDYRDSKEVGNEYAVTNAEYLIIYCKERDSQGDARYVATINPYEKHKLNIK